MAILNHPSTVMFITHGSIPEGMRLLFFPFYGDQPAAAITAEKYGSGLTLTTRAYKQKLQISFDAERESKTASYKPVLTV
jgi:hypothetical protein